MSRPIVKTVSVRVEIGVNFQKHFGTLNLGPPKCLEKRSQIIKTKMNTSAGGKINRDDIGGRDGDGSAELHNWLCFIHQ